MEYQRAFGTLHEAVFDRDACIASPLYGDTTGDDVAANDTDVTVAVDPNAVARGDDPAVGEHQVVVLVADDGLVDAEARRRTRGRLLGGDREAERGQERCCEHAARSSEEGKARVHEVAPFLDLESAYDHRMPTSSITVEGPKPAVLTTP